MHVVVGTTLAPQKKQRSGPSNNNCLRPIDFPPKSSEKKSFRLSRLRFFYTTFAKKSPSYQGKHQKKVEQNLRTEFHPFK